MSIMGNRIKKLREDAKLNQIELAKILKIGNTTLSQYESGQRVPSDEIKVQIANYFNTTVDYLLGNSDIKTPKSETSYSNDKIIPQEFTDPKEAREYIGMHAIFGSEGFRLDTMNDEEVLRFANELLRQMELISYKYKK